MRNALMHNNASTMTKPLKAQKTWHIVISHLRIMWKPLNFELAHIRLRSKETNYDHTKTQTSALNQLRKRQTNCDLTIMRETFAL